MTTVSTHSKGATYPSELKQFRDAQTETPIWKMTADSSINHNLYFLTSYFHTSSFSHFLLPSFFTLSTFYI